MAELIANLGFPIACVCGCAYFIWQNNQQTREDNKLREETMFKQLERFGGSLDNFNLTLIKINTRLEAVEKKLDRDDKYKGE